MHKNSIFIILLSIILFTGCIPFRETIKLDLLLDKSNSGKINGNIIKNKQSSKDYYLALYKLIKEDENNQKSYKIVEFSSHSKAENFQFTVNEGLYYLYACQNPEKITEKRLAHEFYSNKLIINEKNKNITINVKVSETTTVTTEDNILISTSKEPSIFTNSGRILKTKLNNKIFDRDNAEMGLWKPDKFFSDVGDGIYMLESYSSRKIPILFIHGMNGTPRDFEYIINNIDRKKFQPFVYYYPTGINLNFTVDRLKYTVEKLRNIYKFNELIIIAHSMGGLVSRAFINKYKNITIKKYITISTPWNGQKFAQLGKDIAPKILPAFGNMVPKSAFQQNIQNRPLPTNLKHYLIFGYKGKSSLILDQSNDGVISLSSQLLKKAQQQAYSIHGFNESHISILNSKEVVTKINDILNQK